MPRGDVNLFGLAYDRTSTNRGVNTPLSCFARHTLSLSVLEVGES